MVEQAKILEHDADAAPQRRHRVARQRRHVVTELGDQAARRLERQEQQPQQRGLAGAGRPGQELERVRLDAEREVAQDLRAQPVAQADVLESDHPPLSDKFPKRPRESRPGPRSQASRRPLRGARVFTGLSRRRHSGRGENGEKPPFVAGPGMVSDPLTDGWYVGHPITIDAMLIACPNCSTSYMIDPASLGEAGRTVRCARCKTTWFASKPEMAGAGTDDEPTPCHRRDTSRSSEFRATATIPPPKSRQPRRPRRVKQQRRHPSLSRTRHRSHRRSHQPHLRRRRKPTKLKILPRAASAFRHDVRKSGARRDGLHLFLSSSPSTLRLSVPAARL